MKSFFKMKTRSCSLKRHYVTVYRLERDKQKQTYYIITDHKFLINALNAFLMELYLQAEAVAPNGGLPTEWR